MGNANSTKPEKESKAALRQQLEELMRQIEILRTDLEAQQAQTELATREKNLNEKKRKEDELRQKIEALEKEEAEKKLKIQWRKFEKGGDWSPQYERQLIKEVKVYKAHAKLTRANIVLIGHTRAGKSSFINSIASVDLGRIATPMIVGEASTSMSLSLKKYVAVSNLQNFVVYDTMGLDTDKNAGFHVKDIVFLILGNVKPNYRFNPAAPIDPSDKSYVKHPSMKDKAHCVAFVVDSNVMASKSIEQSMESKIEELQNYLRELEIPTVVVLTKIDVTSDDVEEDVKMTYNSKEIKDAVEEACRVFRVPEMHILPVKNYTKESSPESCLNILTLLALRKILQLSSDYLTTTFTQGSKDKKLPAFIERFKTDRKSASTRPLSLEMKKEPNLTYERKPQSPPEIINESCLETGAASSNTVRVLTLVPQFDLVTQEFVSALQGTPTLHDVEMENVKSVKEVNTATNINRKVFLIVGGNPNLLDIIAPIKEVKDQKRLVVVVFHCTRGGNNTVCLKEEVLDKYKDVGDVIEMAYDSDLEDNGIYDCSLNKEAVSTMLTIIEREREREREREIEREKEINCE